MSAIAAAAAIAAAVTVAAAAATATSPGKTATAAVPDYTFGAWPEPRLCVLDQTDDMPVAEAAAAFEGTPVTFDVRDQCAGRPTVVVLTVEDPTAEWAASTDTRGLGATQGEVWLRANTHHDQPRESWRSLLVHELGHTVGLDHTHRHSVMNTDLIYDLDDGLTQTDRAVLDALYATSRPGRIGGG